MLCPSGRKASRPQIGPEIHSMSVGMKKVSPIKQVFSKRKTIFHKIPSISFDQIHGGMQVYNLCSSTRN